MMEKTSEERRKKKLAEYADGKRRGIEKSGTKGRETGKRNRKKKMLQMKEQVKMGRKEQKEQIWTKKEKIQIEQKQVEKALEWAQKSRKEHEIYRR